MVDLELLKARNLTRWENAHVTRPKLFEARAAIAFANKHRYMDIVRRLQKLGSNMPDEAWVFIAVAHERESSMNFNTHLGQGDPLRDKHGNPIKTVHVPAGRGPFYGNDAFEQAAVDAMWFCAPYAARANKDWTIGGMLTYLERYNGLAYANAGIPSPYVWAGTDQYKSGKVLVDHGPIVMSFVDPQPGVAGLLLELDRLDDAIDFGKVEAPSIVPDIDNVEWLHDDKVHDAVWLQRSLNRLGATPRLKVDGVIGGGTRTAIRAFQEAHGLLVDGKAGTIETIPAIIRELAEVEKAAA
jgi:lysozyme family protein